MEYMDINRWYTGKALKQFIESGEEANKKQKRFCFKEIMGFLLTRGRDICALSGIRRTGKTVLMLQAVKHLISEYHIIPEKIAYITIGEKNDIDDQKLIGMIDEFADQGVKYVFIDEISYVNMELEDNSLNLLADRLAKAGIKIVIAGTFSYAIKLLGKEVLFDRMLQIDTTYFSFKEAHDVFGQDIDTFIKYGGIINFDESMKKMTPSDYMETAVVQNIIKSIFKSERKHDLLMTLPDSVKVGKTEEELKVLAAGLIRISIDNYMKILVVGRLANKAVYKYSDVGKLANVIRQRTEKRNMLDSSLDVINLNSKKYLEILADFLGNSKDVPEETFKEIIRILEEIKVKQDIFMEGGVVSVFIPNYLRYGLCDRIVKAISNEVREETNQRFDSQLSGDVLMGNILKGICYLDLKAANHLDYDMYRSNAGSYEVDLLIRDKTDKLLDVYEIKHSSKIVEEQAKHLVNREFIREIEANTGCAVRNYNVLYNGHNENILINPAELFKSLEQDCLDMNKLNSAGKWERLYNSAMAQSWETVEVHYINISEFLCSLTIVH